MKKIFILFCTLFLFCGTVFAWRTPRWGYFPLNVYIEDHPKKAIVERAFKTWETRSDNLVTFEIKKAKLSSFLHVKFSESNPKVQKKDFANAVGLASTQSPLGFYAKAELTIFLKNPVNGKTLSDNELYEISLHEIGHALGLGHSSNYQDIMYPTTHGQTFLSDNDIATLRKIYLPD